MLKFLSVKSVPVLFWSAAHPLTLRPPFVSVLVLVIGLALFGLGEALIIVAAIGVSPWTVFAQGLAHVAGWSIGFATFVSSLLVLMCWLPLRQVPGIGTILNVIIIASVLEFALPWLPGFEGLAARLGLAVVGVLTTGFGAALYLIANLGPGPRDGLMVGLQRVTHLPIAWVRSGLEISVIAAGWLMGGSVGVGTLLFAVAIGPSVAASMYALAVLTQGKTPGS